MGSKGCLLLFVNTENSINYWIWTVDIDKVSKRGYSIHLVPLKNVGTNGENPETFYGIFKGLVGYKEATMKTSEILIISLVLLEYTRYFNQIDNTTMKNSWMNESLHKQINNNVML